MARPCRYGVALFGTGQIGAVHLQHLVLHEQAEVRWIIEEDLPRAEALVSRYKLEGNVTCIQSKDRQRAFNDERVNIVMICSPIFTHGDLIKDALNACKAVFCEKPLSPYLQETIECYELAKEKKLPLLCAFNRRWDPQIRRVYESIQAGTLGTVRCVKSCSRDPPMDDYILKTYLAKSDSLFMESACHDLDFVCWLVGQKPVTVYSTARATDSLYLENNLHDITVTTLTFEGGAIGVIENGWNCCKGYDQTVEVLGSKCVMTSENKRPLEVIRSTLEGDLSYPAYPFFPGRYADSYKGELDYFIKMVSEGNWQLSVTADDVISNTILIQACEESAKTGKVIDMTKRWKHSIS